MKTIEEILSEPTKWKKGYTGKDYYNCIRKNGCIAIKSSDLSEWENSAAGIDTNKTK
jgi:hypothetical protein